MTRIVKATAAVALPLVLVTAARSRATFVNGPVSPGGALIPSLIVQAGGAAR
jgi:hypothetical protein